MVSTAPPDGGSTGLPIATPPWRFRVQNAGDPYPGGRVVSMRVRSAALRALKRAQGREARSEATAQHDADQQVVQQAMVAVDQPEQQDRREAQAQIKQHRVRAGDQE